MGPRRLSPTTPTLAYPRQRTILRRGPVIITLTFGVIIFLLFASSSSILDPGGRRLHTPSLPSLPSPFGPAAHKPPVQKNSTSGDAAWFDDWKWLNPFSSSITFDETRSVLPPKRTRPPIYTYYDAEQEKDENLKAAENKLLLIWRRAWWAQGFKPIVLGKAEAMKNPMFETFQMHDINGTLEFEMMRWLAWDHMGTGILVNWLVLPMGPFDDNLLSYLRKGQYPKLTYYERMDSGIFTGEQKQIEAALSAAISSDDLGRAKTMLEAVPSTSEIFDIDNKPASIASYDSLTIETNYKSIFEKLNDDEASGYESLATLITSHLHNTFINSFTSGLSILAPHVAKSTILTAQAIALANTLRTCPPSPLPYSCPPNKSKCTPCDPASLMPIKYSSPYQNSSSIYTIGTIPHPLTLVSLFANTTALELTTRYIRRESPRDPWLAAVTEETLGFKISGPARIVPFKEDVASVNGAARTLWLPAEREWTEKDMEWHFGFSLSSSTNSSASLSSALKTSLSPTPDSILFQPLITALKPVPEPSPSDLARQAELLANAKKAVKQESRSRTGNGGVRDVVEAWNLADTEAWRFVRAFAARGRVETEQWLEEERKFAGGEGAGSGSGGRWWD
ncbi:MAG: hypothetical protein MMC33_000078 [Icmadophila ericetorum]|nr:hypothetical protein [Icmadophila ericetorum]